MSIDTAEPGTALEAIMESAANAQASSGATGQGEEEVVEEFSVPFLRTEDNQNYQDGIQYKLELFGTGCLECKHLVQDGDVDYKNCHFSRGNTACPAKSWNLVFVGERVKWELRIKKVLAMPKGAERMNRVTLLFEQAKEIESDELREFVISSIIQ